MNSFPIQEPLVERRIWQTPKLLEKSKEKGSHMVKQETTENASGVDKGLVAMFLKMSPEERLQANDNAARTVKELRDGYKQQRNHRPGPERIT